MTPDRSPSGSRVVVAALMATVALLYAALAGPLAVGAESPSPTVGPLPSGTTEIQIVGTSFQPANVTIQAGGTVTWVVTQAIAASHSVTSGSYRDSNPGSLFDSGIVLHDDGNSYSHTFTQPGTYPYFCAVHPDTMSGVITVVASGGGGGAGEAGVTAETRLAAAGVLVVALVLLVGSAALYRRMNPIP